MYECLNVCEREGGDSVCVYVRQKGEIVCVSVCERERKREGEVVCECVCV